MTYRDLLAALLVVAFWGFNFSVIKLGVAELDPFVLAALRFALCAFPWSLCCPDPRWPGGG
ncbi:EamA family transporter [Ideonella sp.]|uniref:EamA family transporter n=1 Tax=Ideonella sp. TaxID=1929293 RepID=UPI003BB60DA7